MSLQIIQFDPDQRRFQNLFTSLPTAIYKNNPYWVPPLRWDQKLIFDEKRHGFYHRGEAGFFLAMAGGEPVGRIVVLDDHAFNEGQQEKQAHFFLFESINDTSVASELLFNAFNWARQRNLHLMRGPKGMTPLDGLGLLTQGFDHRPAFGMPYNPPYYLNLLKTCGFKTESESLSGYLNLKTGIPPKMFKAADLAKKHRGFRALNLHSQRDLINAAPLLGKMYNAALGGTPGAGSLTQDDIKTMMRGLLWIAQPDLVKIVLKGDEPAGFLLTYPDISCGLQKSGGRLLPFGWMKLLAEKRRTKWININGAGVASPYRGLGVTAILYSELFKTLKDSGQYEHAEVIQIGKENDRMLMELRGLGIDFYKTHSMMTKNL